MTEIVIERRWKKPNYTIGNLYVNGTKISNVLEDPDRGLHKNMSLSEIRKIKRYGETAIPVGTYEVTLSFSSKFSGRVWAKKYKGLIPLVKNVPGFDGIRIHPGNTAKDTLGCPLPGFNTEKGKVTNSTQAYYTLMDKYLIPAHKNGEEIYLMVK